jgi:hypothetical protein
MAMFIQAKLDFPSNDQHIHKKSSEAWRLSIVVMATNTKNTREEDKVILLMEVMCDSY